MSANRDEEFLHYRKLQNSSRYLPMDRLVDACLHLIPTRNGHIGQWVAAESGFTLLREKFDHRTLGTEYHWDKDAHGTAKAFVKISEPHAAETLLSVLEARLGKIPYATFMERTRKFCVQRTD